MTELKKTKGTDNKNNYTSNNWSFIFSFFFSFQALWVLWGGGTGAVIGFISLAEEIKKMDPDSKPKKFSFVFFD